MSDTSSGFGRYPLHMVALGLLRRGPQHGYALYQDFGDLFGQIWKAGQTKFYVELTNLEKDGFLTSEMEPQESRPPRKVYSLTDEGSALFDRWLTDPVKSLRGIRVECMAKLRFFDLLNLQGAEEFIDRQSAIIEAMILEWKEESPHPGADHFYKLVNDFREMQAEHILKWLSSAQAFFNESGS